MDWLDRPTDAFLRRLLTTSLSVTVLCYAAISVVFSLVGTSMPEYFGMMFSLDVPLIRSCVNLHIESAALTKRSSNPLKAVGTVPAPFFFNLS